MIKYETGEIREGVKVSGKKKGNPKCLSLVVLTEEIKSTPPYRSFLTFQILQTKTLHVADHSTHRNLEQSKLLDTNFN